MSEVGSLDTRRGVARAPRRPRRSWSPDEDFDILVEALAAYDTNESLPRLVVVVTGKGPLRDAFIAEIARRRFRRVVAATAWLPAADYAALLGAADLGICLHASTSGLDLPMKVVDMRGAASCCLLYTSPSPRDGLLSRMPSSA